MHSEFCLPRPVVSIAALHRRVLPGSAKLGSIKRFVERDLHIERVHRDELHAPEPGIAP